MSIQLTSPAFTEGKPIPKKYTCDGEDISPPLAWSGAACRGQKPGLDRRRPRRAGGQLGALGAL